MLKLWITDLETLTGQDEEYPIFRFGNHAKIVLCYPLITHSENTDIGRMTMNLTPSTQFHLSSDQKALIFDKINFIGYTATDDSNAAENMEVTMRFTTLESCSSFRQKIEDTRIELFIPTLQYPRAFEKTTSIHRTYRSHPRYRCEVSILHNVNTDRFRLTIISRDGLTILGQEVPETFLSSLSSGQKTNFKSPTYVVQLDESGTRKIHKYTQGFNIIGFADLTGERVFQLGLESISPGGRAISVESGTQYE
ncbi:hypothetical protein BDW59DRAFT_163282 [Aspergillus cavernicola]|uniref:Uncharacterized protein n=1 Tax=Aspergillus cavernicola TaxID=176166 RepID=A0ABR4I6X4_9EURO